jgi:pyruvate formate lyase activating enzyme
MKVNFGSMVELSTIDYPGKLSFVIFLRGCSRKCDYCQNKELWDGENYIEIEKIFEMIDKLDNRFYQAVVISGGEPLDQIIQTNEIAKYAKRKGFCVGLHTSGGKNLYKIIEMFDFVLLSPYKKDKYNNIK